MAVAAPIIAAGVSAIGNIAGGKAQADATKQAANLQAQNTTNALNFEGTQYNDLQKRLAPYVVSGATANGVQSALLGQSPYARQNGNVPVTYGSMITLRAPNGQTKEFASNDPIVKQALAKGATAVVPESRVPTFVAPHIYD